MLTLEGGRISFSLDDTVGNFRGSFWFTEKLCIISLYDEIRLIGLVLAVEDAGSRGW